MSSPIPNQNQNFDVLVIGGGINGVAIARECAQWSKRTLLVEQNDFSSGTTSRSTRIIHGGLRYLEHAEIGLVRESLRERERLLSANCRIWCVPAVPAGFAEEIASSLRRPFLRSSLAIRTRLVALPSLGRRQARASDDQAPHLSASWTTAIAGRVYSYEDAQCEFPKRLVAEWLTESIAAGAVACNHTELLEITREFPKRQPVTGARLRDRISGQEYTVHATHIVNATGPWADTVIAASGISTPRMIGGVRGSHLVLPKLRGAPDKPFTLRPSMAARFS